MRVLFGLMLGIAVAIALTARFGPQWSQALEGLAGSLARSAVDAQAFAQAASSGSDAARQGPNGVARTGQAGAPDTQGAAGHATTTHLAAQSEPEPTDDGSDTAVAADPAGEASAPVREVADSPTVGAQPGGDASRLWAAFSGAAREVELVKDYPWQPCFQRAAAAYDVPEALLAAVGRGESGFDPVARSDRDAVGIMQIRWPLTARHLGITRERKLYQPCINIDAGARYLAELLQQYRGDYHLALAAYNYGPTRIAPGRVPPGAAGYSRYIHDQLQWLLVEPPPASDQATRAPDSRGDAGSQPLLGFGSAWQARAFAQALLASAPGLRLDTAARGRGDYVVYLTWTSSDERKQGLAALAASGLLPPDGAFAATNEKEPSYDF